MLRVKPNRGSSRRLLQALFALALGVMLSLLTPLTAALAREAAVTLPLVNAVAFIPMSEQPFYPQLEVTAKRWTDAPLGQVVGESPRETLLNFYAVMALVNHEVQAATAHPHQDPGVSWSPAARARIDNATELFTLAEHALDASSFPQSVREDLRAEATLQLKEVLDYVFTHSTVPIAIPDSAQLRQLNALRSKAAERWTLPGTAITLISSGSQSDEPGTFLFSATTVVEIGRMYEQIHKRDVIIQPYATPGLYQGYISTPGYLATPKWYLKLTPNVRRFLELSIADQTLLQLVATLITLLVYSGVVLWLLARLLQTYRYWQPGVEQKSLSWRQDNKAWYRVLLILPIMPLTRLSELFINDYVNFTGMPLVVVTYLLFIFYFLSASSFFYFLFEALGRSISEMLVTLRGGQSELQLKRVSNLVMPFTRVLGAAISIALIYRLLIVLGLPSATVLAFSAVPGLAIGLGASKLLGNLFAGLSIQTDRPLRVGEFCRIGDNLGFVTRIGLRSLELQTLESRVTIPNAIADEATIINYSRRSATSEVAPMQSLDVHLAIDHALLPEQVDDLLLLVRAHLDAHPQLQEPIVSIEQTSSDQLSLICFALVSLQDWQAYLLERESLLKRLHELVDQVVLSTFTLGVSYDTTAIQLKQLPDLVTAVVDQVPDFSLVSCRLMSIGDFSYNIMLQLRGAQSSLAAFKDALDQLNQLLLIALAEAGIDIPFPTAVEIKRDL